MLDSTRCRLYGERVAKTVKARFQSLLGFAGVVALAVSAFLVTGVNPLDYTDEVLATIADRLRGRLSEPEPEWSERAGGPAVATAISDDHLVVVLNGAVEVRRLSDGGLEWDRVVDWAVPAGPVVVVGRVLGGGFEVLDAATGRVRWKESKATQVWPFRDVVVSAVCADDGGCELRAQDVDNGATQWTRRVSRVARRLAGYLSVDEAIDRYGMLPPDYPGTMPRLVGVVADRQVTVIDTANGTVRGELPEGDDTRVTMVGDRVLGVTAQPRPNGTCRITARAWAPDGSEVWRHTAYDLGTASGSGCEQRADPLVGGDVVAATHHDGRPVLLSVVDGSVRWAGRAGQAVVATDGRVAVVRGTDRKEFTVVDVTSGEVRWRRRAAESATVIPTEAAVIVHDTEAGAVTAFDPGTGGVLGSWETSATLVGADSGGVVLRNGRTLGYAVW